MLQGGVIFGALVLGFFFREGAELVWVVRYVLMWLLFIAFLQIHFARQLLRPFHAYVALVNVALPVLLYLGVGPWFPEVALALLAFTLAPTAAAAAVFAQFLRIDVGAVTVSTLCTSVVMALAVPVLIRWVSPAAGAIPVLAIFFPILTLVGVPLLAAAGTRAFLPRLVPRLTRLGRFSLVLFAFNIWVAGGRASRYLFEQPDTDWATVGHIAAAVGVVCIGQFQLGERLGGAQDRRAAGLSLGRKNNMFGLWVALSYLHPLAALGPICNILWQNAYNSWQLARGG